MRRLTEQERIEAALQEAQARLCGWIHGECGEPRGHSDHVCPTHRAETNARWKSIEGKEP